MALLLFWLKVTLAFLPMLKLVQSMMALLLPWPTVIWLPFWLMVACPAVTLPPVGKALAGGACAHTGMAKAALKSTAAGASALVLLLVLDWPLAHSGAGT